MIWHGVVGEGRLHYLPEDGHPHSRDGECGCGPQLRMVRGALAYVHTDMQLAAEWQEFYDMLDAIAVPAPGR